MRAVRIILLYARQEWIRGVWRHLQSGVWKLVFLSKHTRPGGSARMSTALCTALPARLGMVVIGNEGALVVGGVTATVAGLAVQTAPMPVVIGIMLLAGMIGGGLWITIVGLFYYKRGVNETISSLLMNYIAIALLNHLVNGVMRDPSSLNKPSSYPIPDDKMLPSIGNSNVHYGLVFGIIVCLIAWVLMEHTTFGFKVRMIGGNIRAARMAGLPVARLGLITCFLGGLRLASPEWWKSPRCMGGRMNRSQRATVTRGFWCRLSRGIAGCRLFWWRRFLEAFWQAEEFFSGNSNCRMRLSCFFRDLSFWRFFTAIRCMENLNSSRRAEHERTFDGLVGSGNRDSCRINSRRDAIPARQPGRVSYGKKRQDQSRFGRSAADGRDVRIRFFVQNASVRGLESWRPPAQGRRWVAFTRSSFPVRR